MSLAAIHCHAQSSRACGLPEQRGRAAAARSFAFSSLRRWSALPSSDALERGILRKEAPRNAAWTDAGEEAILSPGLHQAAALQRFKGEPYSCSSSRTTHSLPAPIARGKSTISGGLGVWCMDQSLGFVSSLHSQVSIA